jgi:hypothetical protein
MMTGTPMGCRFLFVEEISKHNIHRKGREGKAETEKIIVSARFIG